MTELIWVLVGAVAGGGVAATVLLTRQRAANLEHANARSRAALLDEQAQQRTAEALQARRDAETAHRQREEAQRQSSVIEEKLRAKEAQFEEQRRLLEDAEKRLTTTFEAAGARALRSNNEQFIALARQTFEKILGDAKGDVEKKQQAIDNLVKPIRELLDKQNVAVTDMEKKREAAYARIDEQIKVIAQSNERLNVETGKLVTALRRPEVRGRWGEVQLRNVVEMAGMTEHCDFSEQKPTDDGLRPDMLVNLPGGGVIPIDAKVALDAYLNTLQAEGDRGAELIRHCQHVRDQVNRLAGKRYWEQFERTPGIVVLFMPVESALHAALECDPELHESAMTRHVLIATPTLLVALLRAVAYGWQQEAVARNAREIAEAGREIYDRLATFVTKLEGLGGGLRTANKAYNDAIGSLEGRLLPGARRLKELRATEKPDIELPPLIETEPRRVTADELRSVGDAD